MIVSAFSALGLQGKGQVVTSPWFVDLGASNHMTGSSDSLIMFLSLQAYLLI